MWHKQFLQGQDRIKNLPKPGRPRSARSAENRRAVETFLRTNRAVSLQDVADEVNILVTSAHRLLKKDMRLSKLCPKFVPKELTQAQKDVRRTTCERNIQLLKDNPDLLQKIVTGDESWISVYEVPTKKQTTEWLPKGTHTD